ncbi:MAG: histidine phosphatase family protein [Bryobacteraceae bacterium]|nr:histidine phosphatase family protein [Bryobacteraceae bacterium]
MTVLTLVRHAQASYLSDNYDRLSPLGERQAAVVGEFWARRGIRFDLAFSGPAERQIRTAAIAAAASRNLGHDLPDAVVLGEFDEFPGEQVVRVLGPLLVEKHTDIRSLAEAFESASDRDRKREALDRLFHRVTECWVAEEVPCVGVESWKQFTGRVGRGVDRIRERLGREAAARVAVFTSAGPTAVVASLALGLSPAKTLALAFSPHNASCSEFFLAPDGLTLSTFNVTTYLEDPSLLTYR